MSRVSPTLEGFRAVFRRPSLTLAEISWRWTVGATAAALYSFLFLEYLDTLPVTSSDILLLRTRQPVLIGQALGHIFHGSLPRIVLAGLVAAVALTFLWIFAASVGRATTVRGMLDYFAQRTKEATDEVNGKGVTANEGPNQEATDTGVTVVPSKKDSRPLGSLLRLNFLRAAVALAAILGLVGGAILVQLISAGLSASTAASAGVTSAGTSPPPDPASGLAFLLLFPLAGLVFLAWSTLNWVLSLAGVFAVRGEGPGNALRALSDAVAFSRERSGAVFAVSTWTGLAHLTVFVVATTVVSMPLSLARIAPGRVVLIGVILITMAYFAVADWLYMVRLAGYVCIAEMPEALLAPAPLPSSPPYVPPPAPRSGGEPSSAPPQTAVDRDEPILSDIPNLVVET
ncbi:MAG TPA: hypothetical protein VKR60_11210 [Candidatus Sulfotelmatobacter sp.]|nr:hypothetical protein [Candidatus Sulfotelmatobacter sp.]